MKTKAQLKMKYDGRKNICFYNFLHKYSETAVLLQNTGTRSVRCVTLKAMNRYEAELNEQKQKTNCFYYYSVDLRVIKSIK